MEQENKLLKAQLQEVKDEIHSTEFHVRRPCLPVFLRNTCERAHATRRLFAPAARG